MKAAFKNNPFRYTVFFASLLCMFAIAGSAFAEKRVLYNGYLTIETILYFEEETKEFMPDVQKIKEKSYEEDDSGQIKRMVNTSTGGVLSYLGAGMREYQVYLPAGYDETKTYPALMLLHDDGYTGASLVEMWKRGADKVGLILLGPTSLGGGWLMDRDAGTVLEAVARDAAQTYSIDLNRLYLFGYGRGGALASHMPVFEPDLFAAIAVHQGESANANMVEGMEKTSPKTPISFFVNLDEPEVMTSVKQSVEAYAKWKFPVHLYIFEKPDNWYYHNENSINLEVLRYFSKHKKR